MTHLSDFLPKPGLAGGDDMGVEGIIAILIGFAAPGPSDGGAPAGAPLIEGFRGALTSGDHLRLPAPGPEAASRPDFGAGLAEPVFEAEGWGAGPDGFDLG